MAVENGVQNAELGYLLFPFEQYSNLAGKPLVGGHLEIFEAGTDTKYISYQNWDGAENPFRIPIPNDGRITVLADPSKTFDCYLYDSYNNLVCSRLNVQANVPGSISIEGADTKIKNTDGTLDISLRTLGNNVREYTVNTHNKVLDVKSPLYFVENSNSATVIGFSGDNYVQKDYLNEYVASSISGKMDVSKLEYNSNGEISAYDGSAFAGGAGDPEVNDVVHANSATWNEVSAKLDTSAFSTVSSTFLTAIPDNYATKDYVQSSVSSKLDSTAFSTVSGNFLTAHQSLNGLMSASLLGMSGNTITSYNNMPFPIGSEGDAEVNNIVHANSATWNNVSAKLDTTAFSTVSANFLTAHQDLSDYVTKEYANDSYYPLNSNPSGYLTKASADALYQPSGNYANATALDGKVDTSSFTAFSSTTNEKIEYISGALSGTYELSAGNGIDITDYPNEQKTVISVTAQGGNKEVENLVTANSATWNSVTGKVDATALNNYATTSQLANKLDTTAFSNVSGSFLTAHQDISNKLDTTAFSDVSGSFLTGIPDSYLQNSDLEINNNKITGISGVPLAAGGGEVPEGVMSESGLEYNAVNEISGYNGSAIAQYGAEKQWLVHDDTLVHAANSAQYALGVNLSAIAKLLGIDETVLYSGYSKTGVELSEDPTNFNYLRIDYGAMPSGDNANVLSINVPAGITNYGFSHLFKSKPNSTSINDLYKSYSYYSGCNTTTWVKVCGAISQKPFTNVTNNTDWTYIYKIVGIGRKS